MKSLILNKILRRNKKVKKFLVVLLSAMMVFAFATTAFAAGQFTDIADLSKEGQDAISKLSALEIIGGYPDGTFKPSATITRAEFAKMACVAGGMSESADILGGTTSQFSDVKANEWYTGYINLAVSQGYVKGYPDGTFKPNNTITNAEVITVIMRILGYNDNLPGPWPVDYVAKAGNLEITTGIVTSTNANAVRGDVARMIDNALEENVVVWNNDIDDFDDKYQNREVTLLADSFKGQTREDLTVVDWSVDSFTKGNLRLAFEDEDGKSVGFVVTDATVISGNNTVYGINDMQADVIYKHDKDLDKDVVKYVDIKSTKVKATKVAADGATKVKVGDKTYTSVRNLEIPTDKNTFFTAYVNEDNIVYLVKNDQNPASDSYIVDEYLASSQRIDTYNKKSITLKGDDVMIFDQNGKAIEPTDLKDKDVIKVYDGNKGDADKVIFVEDWAEGTWNSADGDKMNIDGTSYVEAAVFFDDDEDYDNPDEDYIGTKVKYALNAANEVVGVIYTESGLGNNIYGIVVNAAADTSFTGKRDAMYYNTITIFNQDGKTVKYDVEDEEIQYLEKKGTGVAAGQSEDGGTAAYLEAGDLVKVRLTKEGEIHRVYAPDTELGANTHSDKKADVDTKNERIDLGIKTFAVPNKIAAFDVKMDGTKVDKVTLITREELVSGDVKSGKTNGISFILDADSDLAGIAVEDFTSSGNTYFGFVKTLNVKNADIDYGIKFYDDSKVYEVAGLAGDNEATPAQVMAALETGKFYRYELSGDKVTFIENKDEGADKVEAITLGTAKKIDKVTNGVYKLEGGAEFTVEDNTKIFEITYDKDNKVYDIKSISSVGRGDLVNIQTRGREENGSDYDDNVSAGLVESGLDNFEQIEAEYIVVHNYASGSSQNQNQQTVVGDAVKVTEYKAPVADSGEGDDKVEGTEGKLVAGGKTYTIAKNNKNFAADTVKVNDWVKVTATGTVADSVTKVTLPTATVTNATVQKVEGGRLYVYSAATGAVDFAISNNVAIYDTVNGKMANTDAVVFGKTIDFATTSNAVSVIFVK